MEIPRRAEFSDDAWSLISGLLIRDPKQRLGSGKDGARAIFMHPFFTDIDWVKLFNKTLEPPFVPEITSLDVDYGKYLETYQPEIMSAESDLE